MNLDPAPGWPERLDALQAAPGDRVLVTGTDPLALADLPALLSALDARDLRATLHTACGGLDDDRHVRPFTAWDIRFRVDLPTLDPDGFHAATGRDLDQVRFGMRNLHAFGLPVDVQLPVRDQPAHDLADTLQSLLASGDHRVVRLRVDDPTPTRLATLSEALLDLDARGVRPHPRVQLDGVSALALPVERLTDVDVRTEEPVDAPFPADLHDPDRRAARRVWLTTPPLDRSAHRGHPLDRYANAVSVVLIRPGHAVYAVVDRLGDNRPLLAHSDRFGLAIAGRFDDPTLAARFTTLCRAVHAAARADPPADLARVRALAHVLRRSMKPRHDAEAIRMREEGA